MPRRSTSVPGLLLAVAAATATLAAPAASAPGGLLSHRAAYRLSLADARSVSNVESARGALVLEWRADCSGWLSQQRLGFVAQTSEGQDRTVDVRFSSWEAPDRTRMRFQVRSFEDGKADSYSGTATLEGSGGKGEARYAEPEGRRVDLPPGTVFPTEHVLHLIESARKGERIVDSYVFDGSGPEALNLVTAVIGQPKTDDRDRDPPRPGWPVTLAYYKEGEADALPEFQLSFDLDERGVFDNLVLNYGEFALKGTLEKLEPLTEAGCE